VRIQDPFVRVVFYATLGGALGILIGFVLSMLIRALYLIGFPSEYGLMMTDGPGMAIPFLSMGFGAVMGGIFGGVVGIRRKE